MSNQWGIFDKVLKERARQNDLRAKGKFPHTCADPDTSLSREHKLAILAEEFGEVARAVCEGDTPNLKEELVQVIAVCVAWLESFDA